MNDSDKRDEATGAADRLVDAYEEMLKRTKDGIEQANEAAPKLRHMLEQVRDNMVELGELTREEAAKIADYVERDVEDAAHWLVETGDDLRNWWRFDLELIEQRMLDAFTSVADQTSLQLSQWAERRPPGEPVPSRPSDGPRHTGLRQLRCRDPLRAQRPHPGLCRMRGLELPPPAPGRAARLRELSRPGSGAADGQGLRAEG